MTSFTARPSPDRPENVGAADADPGGAGTVELSIVIPCLNEARTLRVCIDKAQASLRDLNIAGEVIVADNGSTDGSREIAAEAGARVVPVAQRGYGAALLGGIRAARGPFVIMGDADDSYDFSDLEPFVSELRAGRDLVVGNRFRGGIEKGAMPFLHRALGNPALTRIGRRVFGVPCGDIYCGLRGFRKQEIDRLSLQSPGMEFALEMVLKASLSGLDISEVATTLRPDGRDREPHLRTWRDGWRSLRFFLLFSPRWLFLYPGLLLMATGLITMIALLPGALQIGSIELDAHTLLYAAIAIVLGYQCVGFAVFARHFADLQGLLPESARLQRTRRYATPENGLILGGTLLAAGLIGSLIAVGIWGSRSLGDLDYSETLRIVIPSCTLIMLGFETILASFFLSVLGLKRQVQPAAGRGPGA